MPTHVGPIFRLNMRPVLRKLKQLWRRAGEQGRLDDVRQRLAAKKTVAWFDFSQRIDLRDAGGSYTHITVRLCTDLRELASELRRQRYQR